MKHFTFKLSLALFFLSVVAISGNAQISGTGSVLSIPKNTATVVDAGLTLTGEDDITTITIQITGGYVSGSSGDILSYTGTLPSGTSAAYDNTYGILRIYGSASPSEWQTFLRTVTLQSANVTCYAQKRSVTFVLGNKLYNPSNGHFYVERDVWESWSAAKASAESTSYYGRIGYLTTITSKDENDFVFNASSYSAIYSPWIGASDNFAKINTALGLSTYANQAASDGKFYWVTGPEAGNQFSNKNTWESGGTASVSGRYMNWNSGEPNDYPNTTVGTPGEEDYVQFLNGSGTWNDADGSSSKSMIEYGDMPNDLSTDNIAHSTRNITVTGTSSGTITSNNNNVCPSSNSTILTLSGLTGTVAKWQYSLSQYFTNPIDVANTTTSLTATNIPETRWYRAIVNSTSPQTCSNLPTSSIDITVTPTIVGNITAASNQICDGGKVILTLSGNEGNVTSWTRSTSATFSSGNTTIANTTALLTEVLGSTGTYYYRATVNNNSCGAANTLGKTIVVVSGTQNVGGSLVTVALCGGATSGTLTLSGQTGSINKWQSSTDNGVVWSDIASTSNPLSFSGLTADRTTFRAVVGTNACPTDNSGSADVFINNSNGTWTGNTNNNWTTSSNWCGGVPTLTTDVIVPAHRRFDPSVDGTSRCRNLTFLYGGSLVFDNNQNLEVAGSIVSDHQIDASNGDVYMEGASAQTLPGDAFLGNVINNLTIDNAAGITLSGNLLITSDLNLNINNAIITTTSADLLSIDDGATLSGGSSVRYINGPLRKYGNDNFVFHLANKGKYAPCQISSYSDNSATQYYTAEYFKKPLTVLAKAASLSSVSGKEYWNIDRSGTTGRVSVTLYYFDKTFSGIVPGTGGSGGETSARLRVAHFNTAIQKWEDLTGTGSPATVSSVNGSSTVTMTNVTTFSPFTFGSPSGFNPLPVTLMDFVAIPNNTSKTVELKWETASEENSKYFEVMHSVDFVTWTVIGTVNSKGTSNQLNNYSFNHLTPSSVNHYKLREVANNGDYSYSDIKLARFTDMGIDKVVIYPNPSTGSLTLANASEESSFEISDLTGRIIQHGSFNRATTINDLPKGIYIVKVVSDGAIQNEKIIVQ